MNKRMSSILKPLKIERGSILKENEMETIIGSGNSQVRFIPDEYLQAKILNERKWTK